MASGKFTVPKVLVPSGWRVEFVYNSGEFCIDFVYLALGERYRLSWNTTNISYQAYVSGSWQTIWVK